MTTSLAFADCQGYRTRITSDTQTRLGLHQKSTQINNLLHSTDNRPKLVRQSFSGWKTTYPWGSRVHNHNGYASDDNVKFGDSNQSVTITANRVKPSAATQNKSFATGVISGAPIDVSKGDTYVEVELKLPVDAGNQYRMAGIWPAFWLNNNGAWPPEIDIVENRGDTQTEPNYNSLVHFNAGGGKDESYQQSFSLPVDQWFKCGVYIHQDDDPTKRFIVFTYNRQAIGKRIYNPKISQMKSMHPIINLAVGGAWGGTIPNSWNGATLEASNFAVWKNA